jgi:diaminohydroxyphosphoribosylaminopyrimidine deaminase/5-amino-6-(5-phosphoribosylamino)uracil reductase
MTAAVDDREFMARALAVAEQGLCTTTPNPRVGCLLVREGRVVGEGWHQRAGEPHAEANALNQAGAAARGATAYVTLEPCSHYGRTPPCADALIAAGVRRVVAAMADPNPQVAGRGLARLRAAGIDVEVGTLADEAMELNVGFIARMRRGRPWVRVKVAASLDGKTALTNGKSQWITGAEARRDAHAWRARSCAILTGIGTVLADDPALTVRDVPCQRQPLRVVVDSRLTIGTTAKVLAGGGTLVFAAGAGADVAKLAALRQAGVDVILLPNRVGQVDLDAMLRELALRGVNELLVEGGSRLNGALLAGHLVDELLIYQAPMLIGDRARGMFDLPELVELGGARRLNVIERRLLGPDSFLRARFAA